MDFEAVINRLESCGTEQNRKVYKRHGVGENCYGVSYADLKTLKKQIKVDHELALKLWETGNHDARILATMVADPEQISAKQIDAWVADLDNYGLTDALAVIVGATPCATTKMQNWTKARGEWKATAGWSLLARLAGEASDLQNEFFEPYLQRIEAEIHSSPNRVRYSMNQALIGIGIRNKELQEKALAIADRIGKVTVDHGETGCKTPDAASYILKTVEHRQKRSAGSSSK